MKKRLNSPSAINTMNKCRRKYYYKYKEGIPENETIEMLLGNIVHEAIKKKSENIKSNIEDIFDEVWKEQKSKLKKINPSSSELNRLYQEYKKMAINWEKDFDKKASYECEVPLKSEKYEVMGIIDEISKKEGNTRVLDNKTSKHEYLSKDHTTQLAIYALLYKENFGKLPDNLGIRFLRSGKKEYLPIDEKLLNKAVYECKLMRVKNKSDNLIEYPRNPSILCNWGKGKCSYLEKCFP